jgi:tripartite-type tricarboxylate transporter receptor subunit TctC
MTKKTITRRSFIGATSAAAAASLLPLSVLAQRYPDKPLRYVVPYAPGGGTDILARSLAPRLAASLGQPVVVENRAGAGGNIGADAVAKAAPDGYTLLMGANTIPINAALQKLPFDLIADFTPIAMLASAPMVLVVHPSVKASSVGELISEAKAAPGKLNYSNAGNGTPQHLAAALFSQMTGADIVHIVYKGGGPAVSDLVAGQTQVAFMTLAAVKAHIAAGKLKALAVAPARRSPTMPEVPTVSEAGVRGYEVDLWYGVYGPAHLAPEITARLNAEFNAAIASPEIKERLGSLGYDAWTGPPELLAEQTRRDLAKYADIVKKANIKAEQ